MSPLWPRPEPPRPPEPVPHVRTLADVDLDLADARAELKAAAEVLSVLGYADARDRLDRLLDERLAFGQAGVS